MERCETDPDLKGRLERSTEEARGVLGAKLEKHLWSRREISLGTKIKVFTCLVLSVLPYAS